MATPLELLPELEAWNDGAGIPVEDWITVVGRTDQALGYAVLFWPEIVSFEDYILRGPVNIERLRGWEAAGVTRQRTETAMNMLFLEHVFPEDDTLERLFNARLDYMVVQMVDMLLAKLGRSSPSEISLCS